MIQARATIRKAPNRSGELRRSRAGTVNKNPTRRLPVGAEVLKDGKVHFRIWAPRSRAAAVELSRDSAGAPDEIIGLSPEPDGYFSGHATEAGAGVRYKIRLDSGLFPDPASRYQPEGPHGPSEIVDPGRFTWADSDWAGVAREGQVVYELHLGTFTPEGTWRAAGERLPDLVHLGVTVIEVMPIAEFPGRFGWGYDGVDLFAPTRLYGAPDDVRAFVNRAHQLGLGVILDVVYNHIGPDGNYLKQFSEDYFTDRYANEWGEAINFDGPNSGPVREFFIANAGYWIDEFHFDGLRLDATQQIYDRSEDHILAAVTRRVREAAGRKLAYVIAENETQCARLARPTDQGGYGLDAMWNDDFHHSARVALTGRREAYFCQYQGAPQEFISAVKWGFLYQGQWYAWQKKRRGTPALDLAPANFISFIENHDQVANSLRGRRLHQLCSPGCYRAMTALLLLAPATPMLFQGQEFASSSPFVYFADHHPELAGLVARGRKEFLRQFPSIADAASCISAPHDKATFLGCKLDWSERQSHAGCYALHRDLLALRREDPVFHHPRPQAVDGAVLGPEAFMLRFFSLRDSRVLVVNLGPELRLDPLPEPLLAPPEGCVWKLKWSSEDPRYGGGGTPLFEEQNWLMPGHAAVVLASEAEQRD